MKTDNFFNDGEDALIPIRPTFLFKLVSKKLVGIIFREIWDLSLKILNINSFSGLFSTIFLTSENSLISKSLIEIILSPGLIPAIIAGWETITSSTIGGVTYLPLKT